MKLSPLAAKHLIKKDRLEKFILSLGFQIENDLILSPLFLHNRKSDIQQKIFESGKVDYEYLRDVHKIVKPKDYISKELKSELENLVFLKRCCLNSNELERIIISISHELNRLGYCDIEDHVNYTLENDDMNIIFEFIMKKLKEKNLECLEKESLIVSTKFLGKLKYYLTEYFSYVLNWCSIDMKYLSRI